MLTYADVCCGQAEREATELLLKRLVSDMHKMSKRFDTVEEQLAVVRYNHAC
jgi:hypothetical protein